MVTRGTTRDLIFGPVPSRRLGRSLGINHVFPKTCSYACIYCQVGRTRPLQIRRQAFYPPSEISIAVQEKIREVEQQGGKIDFLTLVPDGEPTLDLQLEEILRQLRIFCRPIAVITNASLLWQRRVRQALTGADWVSLKVDAVNEAVWKKINRPHGRLRFEQVLEGLKQFSREFSGTLVTETMLVREVNDAPDHLRHLAAFLEKLNPRVAYLSVPTRPPAESFVQPPSGERLLSAYRIFSSRLLQVELLIQSEGEDFLSTGQIAADLLAIAAVHPLRESALREMLRKAGQNWSVVNTLLERGQLRRVSYRGEVFYLKNVRPSGAEKGVKKVQHFLKR